MIGKNIVHHSFQPETQNNLAAVDEWIANSTNAKKAWSHQPGTIDTDMSDILL